MSTGQDVSPKTISDHDEPIVIDNGPLRVDFGQGSHQPKPGASKKIWTRECTKLSTLVIVPEDAGGLSMRQTVVKHLTGDKVTLELGHERDPDKADKVTFTFAKVMGKDTVTMESTDNEYDQHGAMRGRLKPIAADLRISEIFVGAQSVFKAKANGGFTHKKVLVILIPEPE